MVQYAFTDFNFRIDHHFNPKAKAYLVSYYGQDNFKIGEKFFENSEGKNNPMAE